MIQRLRGSYNGHFWYEQPMTADGTPGQLRNAAVELDIKAAEKKLSFESDRDKVRFLERQSLLLS
jgi:hypothetical protein